MKALPTYETYYHDEIILTAEIADKKADNSIKKLTRQIALIAITIIYMTIGWWLVGFGEQFFSF